MMDDVLVYGTTQREHDQRLHAVLTRLTEVGLTLNPDKCKFPRDSVKFLRHVINESGISLDPDKVTAILKVPTQSNVGDVRRFLGMTKQMFSPNLTEETKPLRELFVKDNEWIWAQSAFERIKTMLTQAPILALFDPNLDTVLSADASSFGLGAVLLQRQPTGELKPFAYISRSMTN